jgi:Mg-chelatase subunit ChlD
LDGIDVLKVSKQEGERSPIVVFLTDGHPTSGVQNDQQILQNINRDNEGEISEDVLNFLLLINEIKINQ